jgi:hypothetical protein
MYFLDEQNRMVILKAIEKRIIEIPKAVEQTASIEEPFVGWMKLMAPLMLLFWMY